MSRRRVLQSELSFDGATYDRSQDGERLARQLDRVRRVMETGEWMTLGEIATGSGGCR